MLFSICSCNGKFSVVGEAFAAVIVVCFSDAGLADAGVLLVLGS